MITYFLKRPTAKPTADELTKLGLLGSVFNGEAPTDIEKRLHCRNFDSGPGDEAGVMFSTNPLTPLVFTPDAQDWHSFETPGGNFALGWPKGKPPGPNELARKNWLGGVPVKLNDDQVWTVPVAKLQPSVQAWTGTKWEKRRDHRYDDLFDMADRLQREVWEPVNGAVMEFLMASAERDAALKAQEKKELTEAEVKAKVEAADKKLTPAGQEMFDGFAGLDPSTSAEILAVNYHVGNAEVGALGLLSFDPTGATVPNWLILDTFVDGGGIRAARMGEKKTGYQPVSN
jgi:hypothetical protein